MNTPRIHGDLNIGELLRRWPAAAFVFVQFRTDCVGCYLNRFCTVEDAASYYGLQLGTLMDNLQERIQSLNTGVQNEVIA